MTSALLKDTMPPTDGPDLLRGGTLARYLHMLELRDAHLRKAKDDPALRGSPQVVYLHLLYELDDQEWKEMKQLAVCRRLEISQRSLRDALNTLVLAGYIEREAYTFNAARRYRLIDSRIP